MEDIIIIKKVHKHDGCKDCVFFNTDVKCINLSEPFNDCTGLIYKQIAVKPGKEIKVGEVVKHNNIYQVRRDDTGFMYPIEWVIKVIEVCND